MPITAQQAFQMAVELYSGARLNPNAFVNNPTWVAKAEDQITKGQFDVNWYSPTCASGQAPPLNLIQTTAGPALATAQVGVQVGQSLLKTSTKLPVIGGIIAGVQLLVSFITAIFAHHAQAVKRDLAFGCAALPAVNNAMSVINAAVVNGTTTPANASAALDSVYSAYMAQGGAPNGPASIPGGGTAINDSPWCNGNCEMSVIVKAMVLYWQSQYNAIPAPAGTASAPGGYSPTPATAFSAASSASAPSTPTLASSSAGYGPLLAIAAVVAFFLLLPHLGEGVAT